MTSNACSKFTVVVIVVVVVRCLILPRCGCAAIVTCSVIVRTEKVFRIQWELRGTCTPTTTTNGN